MTRQDTPVVENEVEAYKQKISRRKKIRLIRSASFVLAGILVILLVVTAITNRHYSHYKVSADSIVEKTDNVSSYRDVGDHILRYSSDGASLLKKNLDSLWNVTYTMEQPTADFCDDTIVIYDKNSTAVNVFNRRGSLGAFQADRPIVKARVSKAGNVAVLLSGGDSALIKYYAPSGEEIASLSSTVDGMGYPSDFDLSDNGLYLSVSYMAVGGGTAGTRLVVYDFGTSGKTETDNICADISVDDALIPVFYNIGNDKTVAVGERGFSVYKTASLSETASVSFEQDIVSAFHDDNHIGFVFKTDGGDKRYSLQIYDLNGRLKTSASFDTLYDKISVTDEQVIMYNASNLVIYTMKGACRYDGPMDEGGLSSIIRTGYKSYLIVTSNRTETITLT